jgi:hypothetical protein
MEVSDAGKLKGPEDENWKLKAILAESTIDNATLMEMLKNGFRRQVTECSELDAA